MSTRHPAMTPNHLHRDTGRKSERDRAVMRWREIPGCDCIDSSILLREKTTSLPGGPCTLIVSFRWTTAQLKSVSNFIASIFQWWTFHNILQEYCCIEDERKGNLSSQTDINCSRAWLFIRVQQLYNTWLIYIVPGVDIDIVTLSKYVSQCSVAVTIRI